MLTTCYMQSNNCLFMKRITSKNTIDYHRFFASLKMTEFCRVMEGLAAAKPPPSPPPPQKKKSHFDRRKKSDVQIYTLILYNSMNNTGQINVLFKK